MGTPQRPPADDLRLLCLLLLVLAAADVWTRFAGKGRGPPGDGAQGCVPAVLDANRASEDELAALPGVGRVLARRIAAARETCAYRSAADLDRVPGIGPSIRDRMAPYLAFGDAEEDP
jgi:hypothetical protein